MLTERVWLKTMKVVDFQSWKDQVVTFSDGLNVFIADNEVGKSVMLKIINCIINFERLPKEAKQNYIRRGCKRSEVTYLFSNNNLYRFTITEKSLFAIARIDGTMSQDTISIRERFIKDFSLIVEPKSGYICNILGDDKAKFLVNTDSRSDGYFLSTLVNHDKVEDIIDITDERIRSLRLQETKLNSEIKVIDRTLDNLQKYDLEIMRDNYEYTKLLVDTLDYTDELNFYINDFIKCGVEDLNAEFILNTVNSLDKISRINFEKLHDIDDYILDVLELSSGLSKIEIEDYKEEIDSDILNILEDLYKLQELSKGTYSEVIDIEVIEDLEIMSKDYTYNPEVLETNDYTAIAQLIGISNLVKEYKDVNLDVSDYSMLEDLNNLSRYISKYKGTSIDSSEIIFMERLMKFSILDLNYHDVDEILDRIQEIKEENETEEVDCPLYGRITIVNGECNI